jgi:hypothetical protein
MKRASSRKTNRVMFLKFIFRKYLEIFRRARPSLASAFTVPRITLIHRADAKLGR